MSLVNKPSGSGRQQPGTFRGDILSPLPNRRTPPYDDQREGIRLHTRCVFTSMPSRSCSSSSYKKRCSKSTPSSEHLREKGDGGKTVSAMPRERLQILADQPTPTYANPRRRPFCVEPSKRTNKSQGKDGFATNRTGFAGSTAMRVAFKAPCLVYYESDYTEVCPVTECWLLGLLLCVPRAWIAHFVRKVRRKIPRVYMRYECCLYVADRIPRQVRRFLSVSWLPSIAATSRNDKSRNEKCKTDSSVSLVSWMLAKFATFMRMSRARRATAAESCNAEAGTTCRALLNFRVTTPKIVFWDQNV